MSDKPDDPTVHHLQDNAEIAQLLADMIERIERAEPFTATLRVKHKDGTVQVVEIGYESDDERDAAMAKILKVLGELH